MFSLKSIGQIAPSREWQVLPLMIADRSGQCKPVGSVAFLETAAGNRVIVLTEHGDQNTKTLDAWAKAIENSDDGGN